jgi:hypothetical protein
MIHHLTQMILMKKQRKKEEQPKKQSWLKFNLLQQYKQILKFKNLYKFNKTYQLFNSRLLILYLTSFNQFPQPIRLNLVCKLKKYQDSSLYKHHSNKLANNRCSMV